MSKRYRGSFGDIGNGKTGYFPNGTMDGHGGRGSEHREEMRQIAAEVAEQQIKALVPQMALQIYRESIKKILRGLQYDIETAVNIAFSDGRDIFNSSKCRKIVSEAIYKELLKGLGNLTINI